MDENKEKLSGSSPDEETIKAAAAADETVAAALKGMNVVKVIVIKGKIVNFVVKPQ